MPQYNELLNVYSNERSFKENERDGKDSDDDERFTFYDKINDIINKTNFKNRYRETTFNLIDNDEDLWKFIYDKHLTGKKIGMRKWSRAKHFTDLIKWFGNNGYDINSNEAKDISQEINWHVNDIKKDFQDAQFVYACFYFGKNIYDKDLDENEINFTGHDEILNNLAITNRISALEKTIRLIKLEILLKSILVLNTIIIKNSKANT